MVILCSLFRFKRHGYYCPVLNILTANIAGRVVKEYLRRLGVCGRWEPSACCLLTPWITVLMFFRRTVKGDRLVLWLPINHVN